MLRLFARLVGFLALAAAFAALVVDGTRSIAGSQLSLTPLSSLVAAKLSAYQQAIAHVHPLLWDPVTTSILQLPLWLALALVGLALMRVAQRPAPEIGFATRP